MNTKITMAVVTPTLCAALTSIMKFRTLTWAIAMTALAGLAMPLPLVAQEDHTRGHHHYRLIDLGTFGGPNTYYESDPPEIIINAQGVVAASADTLVPDPYCINSSCYVNHAFLWHEGIRTELASLPSGGNSYTYSINASGQTAGEAENGEIDPLTGSPEFVAVLWDKGVFNLGTLGGNQSVANAINDRGQIVGAALNAIPDPLSNAFSLPYLFVPAATQARAFLWTKAEGMQDLGTLGGPDSTAAFVNERGQIAGQSYTNAIINPATSTPTQDPFFGKMERWWTSALWAAPSACQTE